MCVLGYCPCCNTEIITVWTFEMGHKLSRAAGGTMDLDNLRPICSICNKSMGKKHWVDYKKTLPKTPVGCLTGDPLVCQWNDLKMLAGADTVVYVVDGVNYNSPQHAQRCLNGTKKGNRKKKNIHKKMVKVCTPRFMTISFGHSQDEDDAMERQNFLPP